MAVSKKLRISAQLVDQIIDSVVWQCVGSKDEGDELRIHEADNLFRITIDSATKYSSHRTAFYKAYEAACSDRRNTVYKVPNFPKPRRKLLVKGFQQLLLGNLLKGDTSSVVAGDPRVLGRMQPKHYVLCMLFYITVSKRLPPSTPDGCLQIICSGPTTVGKTLQLSPILEGISKNLALDASGVGRLAMEGKTVLHLNDSRLSSALKEENLNFLKLATRCERTLVKIVGCTTENPPIHVVISTNDVLFKHKVKDKIIYPTPLIKHGGKPIDAKINSHVAAVRLFKKNIP